MNDTPTVRAVVNSFKDQPILFAILIVNMVTVGGLFWFAAQLSEARGEMIQKLIEMCAQRGGQ